MKTVRKTPGQLLADRITARLVKESLLTKEGAARFSVALASGKLKSGDWRLAIEETQSQKAKSST